MSATARPTAIDGLRAIADRFDHVLLDQYGVLHDGRRPFPGVVTCLERLRAAGKRILVLSNSGKRAAENAARLAALGFAPGLYDGIVTSGEATWRGLRERMLPPFDGLGRRCFAITRGGDRSILDGLDLDLVSGADEAEFLLLAGLDDAEADPALWRRRLAGAAARSVPLVCANPDLAMFGRAGLLPGPGAVAAAYAALGGPVHRVGKPDGLVYAVCLAALGRPDPGRVLAIGDSIDHDVLGGNRAGMLTALVAGGVHAGPLDRAPLALADAVRRLADDDEHCPHWVIPAFTW